MILKINAMIDNSKEYILCAAVRRCVPKDSSNENCPYHKGTNDIMSVELGYRHHDIFQRFPDELGKFPEDQGFYTSKGRFVDRYEGMEIAYKAGQVCANVALHKDYTIFCRMTDPSGELITEETLKKADHNKFNALCSEDLY